MPVIHLETTIHAPVDRVFDLSRSIDLHMHSTAHTKEKAIGGRTSGLIGLQEEVVWRAKHLGFYHVMRVQITAYERPKYFRDEMQKGPFHLMEHSHYFEQLPEGTKMTDRFLFISPLPPFGILVDLLFLKRYMKKLLIQRNQMIKEIAESEKWRAYLE